MKENYDFSEGKRGAIDPVPRGMTKIMVPVDNEILDWFRAQVRSAGGGNYLGLINSALNEYVNSHKEPLEAVVRRVVREELSSRNAKKKSRHTGPRRSAGSRA